MHRIILLFSLNRLTLKYELDIDFNLVAITSSLKDYRLCYFINKVTGLNLCKIDDHELWHDESNILYFSKYYYQDPNHETAYYVLTNRGLGGGVLVPEMKGTDFFFLVKQVIDEEQFNDYTNYINNLDDVLVATEINPQRLKSKENLVF